MSTIVHATAALIVSSIKRLQSFLSAWEIVKFRCYPYLQLWVWFDLVSPTSKSLDPSWKNRCFADRVVEVRFCAICENKI